MADTETNQEQNKPEEHKDEQNGEKKEEAPQGGNGSGIPLLHQWDERWANHPYNWGTVASSGCGPTSFSMIARWYGVDISPADAVDFAANGYHTNDGTSYNFFPDAAQHWGFEMKSATRAEVEESLRKGYPCIAAHGPGMFTNGGHFIVYAKLTDQGKLIVNDPNCGGGGPNNRGDDYQYDLNEVLDENGTTDFIGFICLTDHTGKKPLLNDQSLGEHGSGGSTTNGQYSKNRIDDGIREKAAGGDMILLTKLPEKKTYCEPIYPDYICVSDTVPMWALRAGDAKMQEMHENPQPASEKPNGEKADEKAPNGLNYDEDDIKKIMSENDVLTREQAIEKLSKIDKYTKPVNKENKNNNTDKKDGDKK